MKTAEGLVKIVGRRAFRITWPYRDPERYLFFGSPSEAKAAAKRLTGKWPYSASVREIKM